ncbi:MAG: hypothetical protein P8Y53_21500 [Pseudolabrys sp.]
MVDATFEVALPEIEPNSAEATTETLAAPPRRRPIVAMARSVKNVPPLVLSRSCPRKMKITTTCTPMVNGVPNTAVGSKAR